MKINIIISLISLVFIGCNSHSNDHNNICNNGEMKSAWYLLGMDTIIHEFENLPKDLIIIVDTNLKAKNFVSQLETYERNLSKEFDFIGFGYEYEEELNKLPLKEKQKRIEEHMLESRQKADSIHKSNNQGQNQVWIINNSSDKIQIQMQDESIICILQALTKENKWAPIQYWNFSTCGNSYYSKEFNPMTANSFITKLPNYGKYKTKLRYKLLGVKKFYYSNEFPGSIDYCEFKEDSSHYLRRNKGELKPHYKLDSLIDLTL
jgi:hypothetical protein